MFVFFACCFSQWVGFSFWEGVKSAVEQRLWSKALPVRVKGGSQVSWAGGEQVNILPNSLLLCSREHLGLEGFGRADALYCTPLNPFHANWLQKKARLPCNFLLCLASVLQSMFPRSPTSSVPDELKMW
jgi:hypothetical protein